jgi:hypothetical protein
VLDADLSAPTSVNWFAWAFGGSYNGPGCENCDTSPFNPLFEGTAPTGGAATPLPAALPLFAGGLGGLGLLGWRRKRKAAALAA